MVGHTINSTNGYWYSLTKITRQKKNYDYIKNLTNEECFEGTLLY